MEFDLWVYELHDMVLKIPAGLFAFTTETWYVVFDSTIHL